MPLKKGFEANLLTITTAFKQGRRDSTIIYTSTTKDVDSIVEYLQQELGDSSLCMGYHGKLTQDQRRSAHTSFLTGKCLVIVATIAFGMGIDKADIRRVINYGSPQSIEQYYQMIGRAGRDGYDAECVLIHSETDLNQLCGEFYTKDKSLEQKQAYLSSIEKMRSFANSSECRRAEIVNFFQEPQTFSSCSNCDNCLNRANQSAKSRDYTEECHLILTSVEVCSRSSLGAGKVIAKICEHVKKDTDKKFEGLSQKPIKTYIKPLFEGLIQKLQGMQYIAVEIKSFAKNESGFSPTYSCYSLTFKGRAFLDSKSTITLPVPTLVQLEEERIEKERNQQIQELQKQGLDTGFIGKTTDLEAVNDEIKVRLHWVNALKGYREKGMSQVVAAKEEFLRRILQWRQERAQKLQLAPEAVFKESIAYRIAYTSSSSVSALEAIGRSYNILYNIYYMYLLFTLSNCYYFFLFFLIPGLSFKA
jgi:superfamily II DNA helicase RecQ